MNDTPAWKEREGDRQWPGVEHAYAFVIPSYQWMLTRYEAADSRVQNLIAFIGTVSLAIPTILKTLTLKREASPLLLAAALVLGAAAIFIGLIGRQTGVVRLVSPEILWNKWTRRGEWAFKSDMLCFAGEDFEANRQAIRRKHRVAAAMTGLFLGEVSLFLAWLFLSTF